MRMMQKLAIIYHVTGCLKCRITARIRMNCGVQVETVNIENHPETLQKLKQMGYHSFPVIKMNDGTIWHGLSLKHLLTFLTDRYQTNKSKEK